MFSEPRSKGGSSLAQRRRSARAGGPRRLVATLLFGVLVLGRSDPSAVSAGPTDATPATPLTATQLDELVAPVALYPDIVLDSLLPAATDPLGVVGAARYLTEKGGRVEAAPEGVSWDPGVVALLQFPAVLTWMSENLEWLEQMGFAVSTQQADVLAAIQRYRSKGVAAGALVSDEHQTVTVEAPPPEALAPPGTTNVVIAPAQPTVVYVPTYDPWALLGPTYVHSSAAPLLSFGLGFTFGVDGAWAWHDIRWNFGAYHRLRICAEPWWWGRPRPSGWYWGPSRPVAWRAPYGVYRPWGRVGWRAAPTIRVHVGVPLWSTRHGSVRVGFGFGPPPTRPGVRVAPWAPALVQPPVRHWAGTGVSIPFAGSSSWNRHRFDTGRPVGPTPSWHLGDGGRVGRQIERGSHSLSQPAPPRSSSPRRHR